MAGLSVGFIYARTDSTRLPAKIFKQINGISLLEIIFTRAKSSALDDIYLVTSDRTVDDNLCSLAEDIGLPSIRGDCDDIISRTLLALSETNADRFARLNGDSPLLDPHMIDVALSVDRSCRFVSNLFNRRSPYGVTVELIERHFFEASVSGRSENVQPEHITQHLYTDCCNPHFTSIQNKLDHSQFKFVVDEPKQLVDLESLMFNRDPRSVNYWDLVKCQPPDYHIGPLE